VSHKIPDMHLINFSVHIVTQLYDGCQGVIIMVNPTKEWTFAYAKDLIPTLPSGLEIIVVGNFRDCMEQWSTQRLAMQQVCACMCLYVCVYIES
jgi:hypothetical protein